MGFKMTDSCVLLPKLNVAYKIMKAAIDTN